MERALGLLAAGTLFLGVDQRGLAQSPEDIRKLQEDVAALKRDLKTVQEQQQEIVKQLKDMNQRLHEVHRVADTVSVQGQPALGDVNARVAIIEYADFECPFCGEYIRETFPQVFADYVKTGKVRYFYWDMPLTKHPHAMIAARAARCAAEQDKFWQMRQSLFANQAALTEVDLVSRVQGLGMDTAKFSQCLTSGKYAGDISKEMTEADKAGVDGTPTFLLGTIEPNGNVVKVANMIPGAYPYDTFQARLDEILAGEKGQTPPSH
jgi:protein-disulfide isomerase